MLWRLFDEEEFFVGVAEDVEAHPEEGGYGIPLFGLEEEGVVPLDLGFDVGRSYESYYLTVTLFLLHSSKSKSAIWHRLKKNFSKLQNVSQPVVGRLPSDLLSPL